MSQDELRAIATLLVFIAFIALCVRVYSRKNKAYYDEAANLPFAGDEKKEETSAAGNSSEHNGRNMGNNTGNHSGNNAEQGPKG